MFCWYEYVTCMVGTIMSLFGWCIKVYVWLYEDVCVVLVNVFLWCVGTNKCMLFLKNMSMFCGF